MRVGGLRLFLLRFLTRSAHALLLVLLDNECDKFLAGVHARFLVDMANVSFHRVIGNECVRSYCFGGFPICQKGQNFPFALR